MGSFNIHWLLSASILIPLAAHSAPTTVATEVASGTTTYRVVNTSPDVAVRGTVSVPANVSVSHSRDLTSRPIKDINGGMSQSAKGNLYIAEKSARVPFSGKFNVTPQMLKQGAKWAVRRSPYVMLATEGLQALLDKNNWETDEDGNIYQPSDNSYLDIPKSSSLEGLDYFSSGRTAYLDRYADEMPIPFQMDDSSGNPSQFYHKRDFLGRYNYSGCTLTRPVSGSPELTYYLARYNLAEDGNVSMCGYTLNKPDYETIGDRVLIDPSQLELAIDNDYDPSVNDWDAIFPYIEPQSFTVDPIPSYKPDPVITTKTDSQTGDLTTTETTTEIDFGITNNNSGQPSISVTETVKEDTFINGQPSGSNTTTTTRPSIPTTNFPPPVTQPNPSPNPSPEPDPDTGGNGSFELPSFCSWATTVCSWMDWTQQMPEGEEPDLKNLIQDVDFVQSKTITFGKKQCPAPISLSFNNIIEPIEISFEPFCQLAEYIYFLIMVSAYILAIRITLGS